MPHDAAADGNPQGRACFRAAPAVAHAPSAPLAPPGLRCTKADLAAGAIYRPL